MLHIPKNALLPLHQHVYRRTFITAAKPHSYTVKKKVNCPPKLLYDIVSNVELYSEFVPFVEDSFITAKDANNVPTEAGLRVGWNQFDERFTCKLNCVPYESVVAESLTHQLFDSLHTKWSFKESSSTVMKISGCDVELDLAYCFKNPLYNTMASMFSEQVGKLLIKAFEKRAQDIQKMEAKKTK